MATTTKKDGSRASLISLRGRIYKCRAAVGRVYQQNRFLQYNITSNRVTTWCRLYKGTKHYGNKDHWGDHLSCALVLLAANFIHHCMLISLPAQLPPSTTFLRVAAEMQNRPFNQLMHVWWMRFFMSATCQKGPACRKVLQGVKQRTFLTIKQMLTTLLQQAANVEWDEQLSSKWVSV